MGQILDKCCCSNESKHREYEDFHTPSDYHTRKPPVIHGMVAHPIRQSRKKSSSGGMRFDNQAELNEKQEVEEESNKSGIKVPVLSKAQFIERQNSQEVTQKCLYEDVSKYYNIGKEIGCGKYGFVRLVSKKSYERKRFALKSIPRQHMHGDIAQLEQEFEFLKTVDHPNIIKFYEMYVDDNYYNLVTEFCGGGELFEHIIARGRFSEAYASKIIKQVLSAIKHLHDKNICHRDLKPENILFESKSKEAQVKLIDFGLAKYFTPQKGSGNGYLMKTRIGTPYYMAPEVLEGAYDETCDMWSIGVITYCLLCGYPPFNADTDQQLFRKIKTCDYEFHLPEWGSVSNDAKEFIQGLIQPNPKLRMTPEQALAHKWINSATKEQISKQVLTRLALFKKPNAFQMEILLLLSALLNSKQIKEIRETFSAIDTDASGTISLEELCNAFRQAGQMRPDINLDEIIKRVDFDKNGEINYSEFISGSLDRNHLCKENLMKVFKYLDTENSDFLTYDSLKKAFQRRGDFQLDKFNKMMSEIGLEPRSRRSLGLDNHIEETKMISFQEFCAIMGIEEFQQQSNSDQQIFQQLPQLRQALSIGAVNGGGNTYSTRSNSLF